MQNMSQKTLIDFLLAESQWNYADEIISDVIWNIFQESSP